MEKLTILLLNKSLRERLLDVFTQKGFAVEFLDRSKCTRNAIAAHKPDMVLFDVGMHSEDDFLLYLDIVSWTKAPVLPVIYRKDNSHCTMLKAHELLKDVEAILLGNDYSDQKENLESVRQYPYALTHYHDIFETIPYAIFLHDVNTGAVVDVNNASTELFGYTRDELMHENPVIAYPRNTEFTLPKAMEHIEKASVNGANSFEWCAYKKTGEKMWLQIHLSLVTISNQKMVMAVVHDVTVERNLTQALKASEERFKAIFQEFSEGLMIIDENGIADCNTSAEAMFGYSKEELIGMHPADISPKLQPNGYNSQMMANKKIKETMQKDKTQFRWMHQRKDGTVFWADVTLIRIPLGDDNVILVTIKDISAIVQYEQERIEFQQHINRIQKMQAVATLAGGIAHDFNNMLTSIMGNLNLSKIYIEKKDFDSTQSLQQSLDAALTSAVQAAELVKKLLSFSRKTAGKVERVDLREVIEDVKTICASSFPKEAKIVYCIDEKPIIVAIDRVLITQAIINCCINASHAVTIMRKDQKYGGTITVECKKQQCPEHIAAVHPEAVKDNDYAVISIADDGVGIDENTLQRIFEPFFSSKDKSLGTGLGLSVVYSTITNAGGFIHVESAEGKGSTFSLYIPAA